MGGVGKTQLAADHARHAWENGEVDLLVWVTAASRQAVIDAYAQAAADILHADPTHPERAATAFLAWLEPKPAPPAPRWLIVLDDVADPGDLRGLWPPAHALGRTLLTTRRRDAALTAHGRRVPVGLFTPAESTTYLQETLAAQDRRDTVADLASLAEDLGHLPLALSQAAAYLADTHLNAADYRVRLADRARQLADLLPEPGALPDDQPTPVAAAWSLSLERANHLRPIGLAGPMVQLTAMLDPNGIPGQVLTGEPALTHLTAQRGDSTAQKAPPVSEEEATDALRALHRLSLIDHTPDEPHQTVRVHQLVQRATRDALTAEAFDQLARTAADALMASWPDVEREASLSQGLRANTIALTHSAEEALFRPEPHAVLYRAGKSYADSNQGSAARDYFESLAAAASRHLGSNHLYTLASRHNLAHCQGTAGDASGAADAFAELLPDYVRVLGPDNPTTLDVRFQSARWKGEAGHPSDAADAFAELLPDYVRVLGPDNPTTLGVRFQSARWDGEAGDPSGAADAFEQLVGTTMRVLGLHHPSTQITLLNMAHWREQAGDASLMAAVTDAFALETEAMARELGLDNSQAHAAPNTDIWLKKAEAVMVLTEMLDVQNRALGPDHCDTLASRRSLAFLRGDTGNPSGAAAAFAELLPDYVRVLGPDNPATLDVRFQSARWKGEAGNPSAAAAAFAELLPDCVRVLGPDNPTTLGVRFQSARWKGEAGDPSGAADAFEHLLPDSERVLGPIHPLAFATRSALERWRERGEGDGDQETTN
ncbi:tetratricopeptide repeat protein [Streptomyces sp. NPDC056257]|uniref:tetratricopeptide repeat protein n=1 Tax=Streptomyces sp. NPDC056257 TaxID=3345765 RepID=UPI0035D969DD